MPNTKHHRLTRARALLSRITHLHTFTPRNHHQHHQHHHPIDDQSTASPPSTPPNHSDTSFRKLHVKFHKSTPTVTCMPLRLPIRCSRTRSDMHQDTHAMQSRLEELEMIEMENSSLRVQLDDLQRALDGVIEEKNTTYVGELEMADIENSSLRLQVECLRNELSRSCYGRVDVADKRLAWLNIDAA